MGVVCIQVGRSIFSIEDVLILRYGNKIITKNSRKTYFSSYLEGMEQFRNLLMYADILGNLSQESKEKVKEDPDWADIKDKRDPLLLWRRITQTHINGESLMANLNIYQAQQIYGRLRTQSRPFINLKRSLLKP
jgi:hypothetical protein